MLVNMYWFLNVASIHSSLMSMVNTLPFEYLALCFPKSLYMEVFLPFELNFIIL